MIKPLGVLLADDDSDDRELLIEAFRELSSDFIIHNVADGRKAAEWLENCDLENLPCAVILDYNMPHMTAPQVLEWICARPQFNGIHKFVWSTSSREDFVESCREKGIIEYFVKPFEQTGFKKIAVKVLKYCKENDSSTA
jgi:CheY-like chemotaxis protein